MVSVTINGTQGSLQILDALRDIRSNIQNTITSFPISRLLRWLSDHDPQLPRADPRLRLLQPDGSLVNINYSKKPDRLRRHLRRHIHGARHPRKLQPHLRRRSRHRQSRRHRQHHRQTYALNLPNVYQVAVNQGDTVVLAMVRNSNTLYRLIKLNANQAAPSRRRRLPTRQSPRLLRRAVPDSTTKPSLDRPIGAYFSLDGSTAYVLNCGPECGGKTAGVTLLRQGSLTIDVTTPPLSQSPVVNNVPIPGRRHHRLSDGTTLYLAGQQQQPDGLFVRATSPRST